jgi:REP element-mobilizing transposase RayT
MARPLRVEVLGGRYHLTARGNERRNSFRGTTDYEPFLKLLSELPQRFGPRLHAFVLMPNHFHLLLETPEANLSRAGQWLNLSYSVWFNRKYQRSGHLFQGRFGAVILEGDAELQKVGRYLHLNPVRVKALGLDKKRRAAGRIGLTPAPSKEVVAARLQTLREWEWSSYPAYAGYAPAPAWLCTEALGGLCGGRSVKERQSALRAYCQDAVREGLLETPWERLIGGVVLGSPAFVEELRQRVKGQEREQRGWREMQKRRSWEEIVQAVEKAKGEKWEEFRDRYGDWGRDVAFWLGRRAGRLSLGQLGKLAGGLDYAAVGAALSRFQRRLSEEPTLARSVKKIESQLSKVEMRSHGLA